MRAVDALLADLLTNDDPAAYLVLADALAEAGDPRAALIQAQLAAERGDESAAAQAEALVSAHHVELTGISPEDDVVLSWFRGFVTAVRIGDRASGGAQVRVLQAMTSHPGYALVRSLRFVLPQHEHYAVRNAFSKLVKGSVMPPSLERLRLGEAFERRPGSRVYSDYERVEARDVFSDVWPTVPHLRELVLDPGFADLVVGSMNLPELEDFEYISPSNLEMEDFARLKAPGLKRLVAWTGNHRHANWRSEAFQEGFDEPRGNGVVHYSGVAPLLNYADGLSELREFGLVNFDGSIGRLAPRFQDHAVFERIETLDLSRGRLEPPEVDPLLHAVHRMPRLTRLRADALYTTDVDWARLREGLGEIELEGRRSYGPSRFYYVTAQE